MTPQSTPPEPKPAIMVVDDDATTRKLITRWLERARFNVVQAPDGFATLERLVDRADAALYRAKRGGRDRAEGE